MLPDFRVRQRDYLLEILRAITQELDLDKVLARILTVSIELLAGQAGFIALRKKNHGWLVAVSEGVTSVFQNQLIKTISNIELTEDPKLLELSAINKSIHGLTRIASLGLLSSVGLPMIARDQVIGVIYIFRNYLGIFSTNDKKLLQSFADQAAIAVNNAQLYTRVLYEEQRMVALLESAADGILILFPNHRIERCNLAMRKMIGLSEEEIVGHRHEEIIKLKSIRDGLTLEQAESGGWPLTPNATLYIEGDLIRPNQPPLPVGITYAPLLSQNGQLVNIIATFRDISHFREAEELKSTFISVISHELKTPVALIKGYVGTLRRDDVIWEQKIVQDSLQVIEEEADRLTELIDNLLEASRLQAGGISKNISEVSIDKLAERIAKRLQTQTQKHTLIVEFPDDFPIVLADEEKLGQVITNLITNAIKYATSGGEIRIRGIVKPEQIVVCVSDQGPGVDAKDIPHLFDRFYRSDDAAKMTKGAGLGLYLSRAIIEAHGGRIWIDPKPNAGARFCFSIPRKSNEQP